MRVALLTIGYVCMVVGLIWIGQGTGYFPYPRSSFMVSQAKWAYYGSGLGLAGLLLILVSRRR